MDAWQERKGAACVFRDGCFSKNKHQKTNQTVAVSGRMPLQIFNLNKCFFVYFRIENAPAHGKIWQATVLTPRKHKASLKYLQYDGICCNHAAWYRFVALNSLRIQARSNPKSAHEASHITGQSQMRSLNSDQCASGT